MRQITREDIQVGEIVLSVDLAHGAVIEKFGARHLDQPADWDAPGPVELWFYELPWGLQITLECHLSVPVLNIYMDRLEVEAVLDYLNLRGHTYHLNTGMVELLRTRCPAFFKDLNPTQLFRLDDNGNKFLIHTYESPRVANYYQALYEGRGHKQLYWVEPAGAG